MRAMCCKKKRTKQGVYDLTLSQIHLRSEQCPTGSINLLRIMVITRNVYATSLVYMNEAMMIDEEVKKRNEDQLN